MVYNHVDIALENLYSLKKFALAKNRRRIDIQRPYILLIQPSLRVDIANYIQRIV
jgi:hypothetical protein